jgi:hypothetical protein
MRQCGRKVLKWGKSDGVTEGDFALFLGVSILITMG